MNTKAEFRNQSWVQTHRLVARYVGALLLLLPLTVWAGGVVSNCTEGDLRAAMAGGGIVTFACDGTITLASTITNDVSTTLDGSGHQITISGGNNVRVFQVNSGVDFTIHNLAVANGSAVVGAGIYNGGGTVNLFGVAIVSNNVVGRQYTSGLPNGTYGAAQGGGIFNAGGAVSAVSCVFSNNSAFQPSWFPQGPPAQPPYYLQAFGGAIFNAGGSISLQDCALVGNKASGTAGLTLTPVDPEIAKWWRGLDGLGGAICNSGALTVLRCSFLRNAAIGGAGGFYYLTSATQPMPSAGFGGSGTGGAICNQGSLTIASSAFASNAVTGGNGGAGANGYRDAQFGNRGPGGPAGAGGNAQGGGVWGPVSAVNSTFAWNKSVAGYGGGGGRGVDAYYNNTSGTDGGAGANGGSAWGSISGAASLTNCTLAFNSATYGLGGAGGAGGTGRGIGTNGASGPNGSDGTAGGGGLNGGACVNTLLATNLPGGNNSGALTDLGHNLSSDATCAFTGPGSLNGTDPKLSPLANNGGPTLTMALLPGSPAIDAGDTTAAPTTDQRGFARPIGPAVDIGAYEYGSPALLQISRAPGEGMDVLVYGPRGQSCRLFTSTDLATWVCIATNQIGTNGTALYHDTCDPAGPCRFYRLVMP